MASHPRPISPHLQVYRPQLTSFMSILHRVTGVFLSLGVVPLVGWLAAAAAGPAWFDCAQDIAGSIVGRTLLFLWTGAFFYHLLNGLRHLAWDAGWGFELPTVYKTGWTTMILAAALSVVAWGLAYWSRGAF